MRNAKQAALMAMFARSERRNSEAQAQKPIPPWETAVRPIELNLHMLAQKRMAAARKA